MTQRLRPAVGWARAIALAAAVLAVIVVAPPRPSTPAGGPHAGPGASTAAALRPSIELKGRRWS